MKSKYIIVSTLLLLFSFYSNKGVHAQQVQKAQNGPFFIQNATIHSITNGIFVGDILIQKDRMVDVGVNLTVPSNAILIDATNKHVYPGFIDSGTRLGLSEVGSISLTNDYNELGDFIPHMKALTAVNPNSVSIPVTRVNGVTTVLAAPQGGRFPGTAALIDLFGYTPQQMSAGAEAVLMNFPSTGKRGRWDRRSEEDIKKDSDKAMDKLNAIWEKVILYAKIDSTTKAQNKVRDDYNPMMDALLPIVNGQSKLFVEVNAKSDIEAAIEWIKKHNIKAVFTGVDEGAKLAKELSVAKIDVITGPVLKVPGRSEAKYDHSYTNAAQMQKAGVKVAIRTNESENVRNLPFNAGFAATYGMGVDEALKSITIIPAQIFGVDADYGSVEKGKIANLFISDGDPFEMKTKITHLFIKGWQIPLESRHTLLFDEFLNRSPGID